MTPHAVALRRAYRLCLAALIIPIGLLPVPLIAARIGSPATAIGLSMVPSLLPAVLLIGAMIALREAGDLRNSAARLVVIVALACTLCIGAGQTVLFLSGRGGGGPLVSVLQVLAFVSPLARMTAMIGLAVVARGINRSLGERVCAPWLIVLAVALALAVPGMRAVMLIASIAGNTPPPIAFYVIAAVADVAVRVLLIVALGVAWRRTRRLLREGLCRTCGYDLRAIVEGRCPECGAVAEDAPLVAVG